MDWAYDLAADLSYEAHRAWRHDEPGESYETIAAALRKAKADGFREGAIAMETAMAQVRPEIELDARLARNSVCSEADAIEKGGA
jgi:hypothetical protein